MSGIRLLAALCLLTTVALAWWGWMSIVHPGVPSPMTVLRAVSTPKPESLDKNLSIASGMADTWRITLSADKTPGRMCGYWTSEGKTAGIRGAQDDTLVSYALRGPNNQVLASLDHPASSNFDVHCVNPGVYTFEFNNSGLLRSSTRNVTIHLTYQADR